MSGLFHPEGKLNSALSVLADVIVINLMVVALSLPLITAGAAMSAGHFVLLQILRGEGSRPLATFWRRFRGDFTQATPVWLGVVALVLVGTWEFYLLRPFSGWGADALRVALFAGLLLLTSTVVWYFPLCSQFSNTVLKTLANSVWHCLRFLPRTLAVLVIYLAPVAVGFVFPGRIPQLIMVYLFFGAGFTMYLQGLILFKPISLARQTAVSTAR